MTRPRNALVSLESTRYYHVMSRCVRRAFLCGVDKDSGNDYEHRREWIEARIHLLSSIFAIDICAYAVMSNHYHIVLDLSPEQIEEADDREVTRRWQCLFKGTLLFQQYSEGKVLKDYEQRLVDAEIAVYRQRLCDLSWFMKCLNEPLARIANKEDSCKGHFWEHRYKSQALCSDEALLSCMAYVDLNPIRAAISEIPEKSDHTSIQHRLNRIIDKPTIDLKQAIAEQYEQGFLLTNQLKLKKLLGFNPDKKNPHHKLPFSQSAYIELVEWTGRVIRNDKRSHINNNQPPILERLNIDSNRWLSSTTQFEMVHRKRFGSKPAQLNTG